jgi:hypothetical protein
MLSPQEEQEEEQEETTSNGVTRAPQPRLRSGAKTATSLNDPALLSDLKRKLNIT